MGLQAVSECVCCGAQQFSVLVSRAQLTTEKNFGRQFFCGFVAPDTPDYMLQDRIVFTNDYDARLIACVRCGLVARDPRFTPLEAEVAYANDQYHPAWLEAAFQSYRRAFAEQMPAIIVRIGSRARVLELGSYVGGFLAAARDFGLDAQGVDVGTCVGEFKRAKGLRVRTGTLASAHFDTNAFDAVCVWNCFDQLPAPWPMLTELKRVLCKDGWLMLRVPNGEFITLVQRVLPCPRAKFKLLAHTGTLAFPYQFGYTPRVLRRMLAQAGFRDVRVRNDLFIIRGNESSRMSSQLAKAETRYLHATHALSELIARITAERVLVTWRINSATK